MATEAAIRKFGDKIVSSILDETFFSKTEGPESHVDRHVMINDYDLLDRVLSDKGSYSERKYDNKDTKRANTGFSSLDEAYTNIEEGVIFKSKEIAEWVLNPNEKTKKSFSVTLSEEDGYEPVGYGYMVDRKTNQINHYSSNTICIVLKKDPDSELGFNIHTAYPDITKSNHRKIVPESSMGFLLKNTKTYKKASPVSKAYMLCQIKDDNPYLVTFKEGQYRNAHDDVLSIQIPYKDENGEQWRHTVRIKENKIEFSTSKLVDVHIAKKDKGHGHISEKIIYPGEDVKRYEKEGVTITKEKRYVKQKTRLIDKYARDKELSVSLTNPEVFEEFGKRHPKAAEIVAMCGKSLGMQCFEEHKLPEKPVTLDESLLPRERNETIMQATM